MLFIALLQTLCATSALAQVSVQTPSSPYQCESSILTWTGGQGKRLESNVNQVHRAHEQLLMMFTSPLYPSSTNHLSSLLTLLPIPNTNGSERLGPIDEMSVPYTVKVPAGERVRIIVRDSTIRNFNESAFTDPIIIGKSTIISPGQADIRCWI